MRILRRGRTAALAVLVGLGLHAPASAIVGGADATTAEYPWLAAIGTPLFLNRANGQFCGGALIAPDQVITAAHCVALTPPLAQTLTVTFGRDDLRGNAGNTVQVKDIRIHPGFRVSGLDATAVYRNDVAILTLDQPQPGPTVGIAGARAGPRAPQGGGGGNQARAGHAARCRVRGCRRPSSAPGRCGPAAQGRPARAPVRR
ncbi:S1 family peptidase [Nocardia abscessus]|uniref:S1 family peptidase n=1 Tax=Nocardia abscessus TaxID=120957 RepID=UPI00245531AD|nr:trypsin-like serine protease [Nocardia abscessus]